MLMFAKEYGMGLRVVFCFVMGSIVWLTTFAVTPTIRAEVEKPATVDALPVVKPPLPLLQAGPRLGPTIKVGEKGEYTIPPTTGKWIDVDLSEQRVVAYEGTQAIRTFVVSTGLPATPTVQGEFRIRMKVRTQTMSGGSPQYGYYNIPNVEWVQYFHGDYAFHGTYWHNNFGQPMSHGCVNMTNEDAEWLFYWAGPTWQDNGPIWQKTADPSLATLVIVHE
ncbi:MAG: L,D-transpeptidase [Caldilineaceae bacterium]|nr:L,D-transpeptidase [Caldilineaceae bacterium]